jgi:hypothetical protein
VYRSRSQQIAGWSAFCFFGLVLVGAAVASGSLEGYLAYGIAAVPVCTAQTRVALSRVCTSASGIEVRNLVSNFALKWDEIDHFDIGRTGFLGAVCRIHTRNGDTKHAFAIQESHLEQAGSEHPAAKMVNELNRKLHAYRTDAMAGQAT